MSTESTGYQQAQMIDDEFCDQTMVGVHSYNWRRLREGNMELRCICGHFPGDPETIAEELRESAREQRRQKIEAIKLKTADRKAPQQGKLPL